MSKRFPRAKWVLPSVVNPPKRICFQIQVPDERFHVAAFLGALYNLTSAAFWGDDSAHTALQVAQVWQEIYDNISRQCVSEFINTYVGLEDNMPFFRQICEDGKCYLEFECCPGEWVRLGNSDQIPPAPGPGSTPPPAPNGAIQKYCNSLQGNGHLLVGPLLNSGDIISLISAGGSCEDGGPWYCPDGSLNFAGCQEGSAFFLGGDPVPSAPHMSLIININGSYYPLKVGVPLTVPGGVSNNQSYMQVNDDTLADIYGQYDLCFTVQNNQPGVWTQTFNLDVALSGWENTPTGFVAGSWTAGTGWTETDDHNAPANNVYFRRLWIRRLFTATNINSIEIKFSRTNGFIQTNTDTAFWIQRGLAAAYNDVVNQDFTVAAVGAQDLIFPVNATCDELRIYMSTDNNIASPAVFTGSAFVAHVIVSGTGSNPF